MMPRLTAAQKALDYIAQGRVTVTSANEFGIRLSVVGSAREPYRVAYGRNRRGYLITECTCANTEAHPVRPACSHVAIAKLLWRD